MAVGDPQWPDNVDSITLDGVKAIDRFAATAATKTLAKTVRVAVSDGRLTLDSTGGTNTKVAYIDVVAAPLPTSAHVDFTPPARRRRRLQRRHRARLRRRPRLRLGQPDHLGRQDPHRPGRQAQRGRRRPRRHRDAHPAQVDTDSAGKATSASDPARWELAAPQRRYDVTVPWATPSGPTTSTASPSTG